MVQFVTVLDGVTNNCINNYMNNLNQMDRSVRKMKLYHNYIISTPLPQNRKNIIISDVSIIDRSLKKYPTLYNISWKIAVLNKDVENNLPHTHNDIIFLPQNFFSIPFKRRVDILLHEKIHIYQRLFPIQTQKLYTQFWYLIPYTLRSYSEPYRSNPDVGNIIYAFYDYEKKGFFYHIEVYKTNPQSITSSETVYSNATIHNAPDIVKKNTYMNILKNNRIQQYEHPNETMACLITSIILDKTYEKSTMKWMDMYA